MTSTNLVTKRISRVARVLALVWACWWTFFMLASGAGGGFKGVLTNAPNALPGLVFLISVAIAWKWEAVGGIVLMVESLLILIVYPLFVRGELPLSGIIFVMLTLGLLPLVAGILFLVSWQRTRRLGAP